MSHTRHKHEFDVDHRPKWKCHNRKVSRRNIGEYFGDFRDKQRFLRILNNLEEKNLINSTWKLKAPIIKRHHWENE